MIQADGKGKTKQQILNSIFSQRNVGWNIHISHEIFPALTVQIRTNRFVRCFTERHSPAFESQVVPFSTEKFSPCACHSAWGNFEGFVSAMGQCKYRKRLMFRSKCRRHWNSYECSELWLLYVVGQKSGVVQLFRPKRASTSLFFAKEIVTSMVFYNLHSAELSAGPSGRIPTHILRILTSISAICI